MRERPGTGASSLLFLLSQGGRYPRDVVSKSPTKIQRGLVNGQMVDRSPQFQVVSVTAAFVTVVTPATQVD